MKRLLLLGFLLASGFGVLAQARTVTGQVTGSDDKQPLPGVNVVIQGSARGTVTDIDGRFSIELQGDDKVLSFSFVGYATQTVTVGEQTTINVELASDTKLLQDVVVVGYGTQKKSDVTGATANIKGEELTRQPVLTATQAIQGKVAGVQIISSGQPGSSPQIRVRGVSTALGATTALYVVDGVLTDDISNINTADIVDMNILKDASAAAIYGSRGANGVIIITTKRGKSGDLKVSYNTNVGIRQAANLVKMANAAEYANYVEAATGKTPAASSYDTDWYKTILRNAVEQTHNISVSGGTDKFTHLLNVGYLNDNGIVVGNNFKRVTVRLNQDYILTKWLRFGLQSSYGNSINQNGFGNVDIDAYGNIGSVYNDAYRAAPIIATRVNGLYGNTSAYQNVGNPLLDINDNSVKVKESRLQGSSFLELKPSKSLTLRSSFGGDLRNSLNRVYNYKFSNDQNTFLISGGNQYNPNSGLTIKQTQSFRWVWDNTATFTKKINDHDFTVLVGTTAERYLMQNFRAYRRDVPPDPSLWYIKVGDANSSQNEGEGDAWARNSYLARVNYSYREKYLITATYRADGSSRLPKQNRWQRYPSVGVGWVISNESFMDNQSLFDFLKLRASYGKVGNDQIPTDAYTNTVELNKAYAFNGSVQAATNGVQINRIIDPNIKWETTEEYDAAMEFGLLKSKLSGEVNYYNKKVQNALMEIPIPRTVGDADGIVITNVGTIQNRGLEVALNWKDRVNQDFSYTISINSTFNQNRVLALNGGQAKWGGGIGAAQGYTTLTANGKSVGSFYVLQVVGVFNSGADVLNYKNSDGTVIQPTAKAGYFKYLDKNGDGQIDDSDRVFAGSYQPVAYYGGNITMNYKSWDLALAIYGNAGNKVYNGKKAVRVLGTDNVEKSVVYNRWTSGNHTQSEPAANTGNQLASTYFVESGSFVRVNNLTIGYKFGPSILTKAKIKGLRVFIMSQNLFTYKKYSGFTAELPGSPLDSGIELSAYPTTRTIAAGINLDF